MISIPLALVLGLVACALVGRLCYGLGMRDEVRRHYAMRAAQLR